MASTPHHISHGRISAKYHFTWGRALVLFVILAILSIRVRFRKGLRQIPGPMLCSVSGLGRVITAASGRQHLKHIEYHKAYGALVRVGPNHVSIGRGEIIPQLYGISNAYPKSKYYSAFDAVNPNGGTFPTMFSLRDEKAHKALKRPVANAYSMSAMVELEPVTDACIKILERKLDTKQDQSIDFGKWLHWYAFDVITSITFSDRLGFMEQEKDINGIISAIEGRLVYNSIVGQVPSVHQYLLGNRLVAWIVSSIPQLARLNSSSSIVAFASAQLAKYNESTNLGAERKDLLSRFKRFRDGESMMTNGDVLGHATSNIFAGSDTTAISLRSVFYYLCKNRNCYDRLVAEIDTMEVAKELSDIVTFAEASRMEYLQACLKEAMRLHPAVGQLLERVVPTGGASLGSAWVPAGTIIGVNPWVVARERTVYGEDAEEFRPDRWLSADPETLKQMNRNFLAFGSGGRTCLGKNIALLEMSKLVPQLLRHYDIELANRSTTWDTKGFWFVKQTNLLCLFKQRPR